MMLKERGERANQSPTCLTLWQSSISAKEKAGLTSCRSRLYQRRGGGRLQPALSYTCTKLDEMEMGNILFSLLVPLPPYVLFGEWQYPPLLLRKRFAFLQEQLPSLENVGLFLHIFILWLIKSKQIRNDRKNSNS